MKLILIASLLLLSLGIFAQEGSDSSTTPTYEPTKESSMEQPAEESSMEDEGSIISDEE